MNGRNGQDTGVMAIQDNLFPIPLDIQIRIAAFAVLPQFSLQ